jgi:hypothetical protein
MKMFSGKAISTARLIIASCFAVGLLGAQTLTITSSPTLPPASVSVAYPPVTLTASGGVPPYTWTVLAGGTVNSLPMGLSLSTTGVISGTPTATGTFTPYVRVTDSAGNVYTTQFSITVGTGGTLTRTGVIAQIAAGSAWATTVYLINTSATAINSVTVTFRNDDGSPLSLALTSTQQGYTNSITAQTLTFILNPLTTVVIQTTAPPSAALQQGWADVFSTGGITSFAIFQQTLPSGIVPEGTSGQQGQFTTSLVLPFNNTNGNVTSAALISLASVPITVSAAVYNLNGTPLATTASINMPILGGPTPFEVPTLFPATAGQTGIVIFTNVSTTDPLTGIAFSFGSNNAFTSVPMLPPPM